MVSGALEFNLTNQLSELGRLRAKVDGFAENLGLNAKQVFEMHLALEEIFTNIISHGFKDDAAHDIRFAIKKDRDALVIRVEDDGVPFNPVKAGKPDTRCPLEERKVGGLGVHLVRRFAQDMNYVRKKRKNVLTIRTKPLLSDNAKCSPE